MRVLVTGGAGFVGSTLVRRMLLDRPGWDVITLDLLTYAGRRENLDGVLGSPRLRFVRGDICDRVAVRHLLEGVDAVFNLAAETHVDRSIRAPATFLRTNVLGTQVLLDAARERKGLRFLQVSTDEVYGQLPWVDPEALDRPKPRFTEDSPVRPRSPYAVSKAAADHLVLSYGCMHAMDVVVARGSNNFGPRQHREKLVPLTISKALDDDVVPLYGDGLNVRDWMSVEDFCAGILAAFDRGRTGSVYNFGGDSERTNLYVVGRILDLLGVSRETIRFVDDRPGHDRRYGVDYSRAKRELDWSPSADFDVAMRETVDWYRAHPQWLKERATAQSAFFSVNSDYGK